MGVPLRCNMAGEGSPHGAKRNAGRPVPDYAALHPGYPPATLPPKLSPIGKAVSSGERTMSKRWSRLRPLIGGPAALVFLLLVAAPPGAALAQAARTPDAVAPVEEFSRQLDELKKTFLDLSRRIETSAKAIDKATDPAASRKEIADLREIVSALLGAVADNGDVARLGAKALEHARAKQKSIADETRYTAEQRAFLLRQWERLARETEAATGELDNARSRFA